MCALPCKHWIGKPSPFLPFRKDYLAALYLNSQSTPHSAPPGETRCYWIKNLCPSKRASWTLIVKAITWQIWLARNECIFICVLLLLPLFVCEISHMFLLWVPAVPAIKKQKLESAVEAMKRSIQLSGSSSRENDRDPNSHVPDVPTSM